MSQPKLKLLEERLLHAVARVRSLREERDRVEGELREMRRRLEELGRESEVSPAVLGREMLEQVRGELEEAVRELREKDAPAAKGSEGAPTGGA